jgi:hypothetical protein
MKKLEELLKKRETEIENERKVKETRQETRKNEIVEMLWFFPLKGAGIGFGLGLIAAFFRGCGLFHYNTGRPQDVYLFHTQDVGSVLLIFPIIGAIIGLICALISSTFKNE